MSDFPVEVPDAGDPMAAAMENLHKTQVVSAATATTSSTSSVQSTQMLANSSSSSSTSSSSRVAKTSSTATSSASSTSRMHSVQEMKASSMKSDLCELKSSITEMKNLSASSASLSTATVGFGRLRSSMEELDAATAGDEIPGENDPIVTFPDDSAPPTPAPGTALGSPSVDASSAAAAAASISSFEQKRRVTASKTQVMQESFSAEQATRADRSEMTRVMGSASSTYSEQSAQAAMRRRLEVEGLSAEDALAVRQEQRSLKAGEITQQETRDMAAASMKLHTDTFTSEKKAMTAQQQRQTMTTTGMFNHEKHMASSQSNFTITTAKGVHTKAVVSAAQQMSQMLNGSGGGGGGGPGSDDDLLNTNFDDLERLSANSSPLEVERAIKKYSHSLDAVVKSLKRPGGLQSAPKLLGRVNEMMQKAWAVPTHGHELGYTLCNALRTCGGLDLLMANCASTDGDLQFASARLLEQCLTTENRAHVVENGLEKVVKVACGCTRNSSSVDHSRTATGILEHLFKHSEGTCSDVIKLGGLDAVLFECRKNDVETLRHCAGALANLSLYGGAENQEAMIKRKVPMWLFPLAFHNDDNIKYYACLAIAVLVANKEIEAAVLKSGTLDLVEPFVTTHNPSEFAKSNLAHAHGQSKHWLQRLVPVLSSKREEARNLAAFHFCMEAGIKRQQGNTELFREIGAIEPLKKVASCPNAVASKYAAQALRLIGEEVPHKLSQQVPLWSTEDVREWVKQIGFPEYASNFVDSRVDGDLLLQLTEDNLREDIGITNGIRRRRFTRELQNLKKMADYSSRDIGNLNMFLQGIAPEFSIYTYSMLNAGVDMDSLRRLSEDQLLHECGIPNSIHRLRILESIRVKESDLAGSRQEDIDKSLDVFVSYRRSNGSQLASLLKVHLQLRGFTVFIDVERLEAGKFDNNLLQSIRTARHFLLVLTPRALERCIADTECKDWVHREIVAALQSNCNIIPIIDNFTWPEPEELPEDMRAVCHFNGVRWIHDYQDACVDKLERFMRGELNIRQGVTSSTAKTPGGPGAGDATPGTPGSLSRQQPQYQRMVSSDSSKGSDKDRGD